MTGYDKSPDYAPQVGRWTLALLIVAMATGVAAIALLSIG